MTQKHIDELRKLRDKHTHMSAISVHFDLSHFPAEVLSALRKQAIREGKPLDQIIAAAVVKKAKAMDRADRKSAR